MFHKENEEGAPCRHMENHLQRTADGTAPWLVRLYAVAHAAGCPRCSNFLSRMEEMLRQLRATKQAPPEDVMERLANGAWRRQSSVEP
jgi:NMD protein affecting ribosome stability and mRNA decay